MNKTPKITQSRPGRLFTKVPEITIYFWITKILTTGMGETTSDYFVNRISPIIAVLCTAVIFVWVLKLQFASRQYTAWRYWLAVVMVSVFGTMGADVLHIGFGVPYLISTIFFSLALTGIFVVWFVAERSLSIHSIYTRRREAFYWLTILTTFALGTAAGDMTATTMHLGYLSSGLFFSVVMAIPLLGYFIFGMPDIFAFWFAYIVTRPLGASFADWMGVSHVRGGLAWGTGPVSLVLAAVITGLVAYLSVSKVDIKRQKRRSVDTHTFETLLDTDME